MKKFLVLFVVLTLCFATCSCAKTDNVETAGETVATTETTQTPEPTPPPVQKDWAINYYVDDFNEPTSDWFILMEFGAEGTFSNSAVTDARLNANIFIDQEDVAISLLEYAKSYVKNNSSYSYKEYTITMKTDDGNKQEMTGKIYCGGDRIILDQKYRQPVIDALCNFEKVGFYIVNQEYQTTTYLFNVPTSNFSEVYQEVQG